ncbi:hypothetical protein [Streptomyces violaceusniger]|uniref:hypothetical protein n=1 Tax=Streptomyces violaceusniger TaxID=68280 RepID=UPI0001E4DF28|nr:hypothetical protein [Streptomyces violaceusniger]
MPAALPAQPRPGRLRRNHLAPYGDLHHYAHSAHPAVRWNHLPALERHLQPHFTPDSLLTGLRSVIAHHGRALVLHATARPGTGKTAPSG